MGGAVAKGSWREPVSLDCHVLSTPPQVGPRGFWLCEATDHSLRVVDKEQSEVSGLHGGQR